MPLDRYYDGNGEKVMGKMQKTYGADKGKSVFYALANKRKAAGDTKVKPPSDRYGLRKS